MTQSAEEARLVVYDDSEVFGGHEVMTLRGLQALLDAKVTVLFFYARPNTKLRQELESLQRRFENLALQETATPSRKLQGVRSRLEFKQRRNLARQFVRWGADAVLCAQGDLELSSLGVLAAKQAGLRTVSYIPFAHTLEQMGAKFGRVRDPLNGYLLQAPDAFITISQEAAQAFQARGSTVPIEVVYNGIDLTRLGGDSAAARRQFSLPSRGLIVALCGRLERIQKGQQLLLEALTSSAWLRQEVTTLFVGDGPDEAYLKAEVQRRGLTFSVRFTGWCDLAAIYPALDAVVVASRYEGMPLVMLEALASKIPVLGTDRDGMRDLLPAAWRFPSGNATALAEKLEQLLQQPVGNQVERLCQRVRREMSIEVFQNNFKRVVFEQCKLKTQS